MLVCVLYVVHLTPNTFQNRHGKARKREQSRAHGVAGCRNPAHTRHEKLPRCDIYMWICTYLHILYVNTHIYIYMCVYICMHRRRLLHPGVLIQWKTSARWCIYVYTFFCIVHKDAIYINIYMYVSSRAVEIWRPHTMANPQWGVMGWLQLVGSIKLQFSFAEYILFYRAFCKRDWQFNRSY